MKRRILNNCLDIALKNNNALNHPQWDYYHHFSFIISTSGKIVEWGVNRRSSPLSLLGYADHSKMHSEIDAYFKAKGLIRNEKFDVVNIRLTKTSRVASSKPCACCFGFLKKTGARKIYFTTNINSFACIIF